MAVWVFVDRGEGIVLKINYMVHVVWADCILTMAEEEVKYSDGGSLSGFQQTEDHEVSGGIVLIPRVIINKPLSYRSV